MANSRGKGGTNILLCRRIAFFPQPNIRWRGHKIWKLLFTNSEIDIFADFWQNSKFSKKSRGTIWRLKLNSSQVEIEAEVFVELVNTYGHKISSFKKLWVSVNFFYSKATFQYQIKFLSKKMANLKEKINNFPCIGKKN